ncbi:DedA family protein/thiosulfate sulfurtransferase GlpE [Frateuria soli]|uniref:DedA family protein/thiosulfate sulfurtransferase GlpE n=1 Tax=Frateuria soli TaxID=1542730 RepID=UPI001E2F92C1|nr:DedA family protein/thiosulfate sulfurtransferase GlpE [Frateuria soli]UGB38596.1 DedA family protein/thiosulfate sulfurtransferase GlpE [Frateuria soli]
MAHQIVALIAQYGLLLVFLNVLVAQAGLPLPAVPTLVVAGTLAAVGKLPLWGVLMAALAACLISDFAWYAAGRRYGAGVMRTLCRVSLSPDSCVRQSELRFQRWRAPVLLVAKFVPGLSTVAPPLVGAMGLKPRLFLLFDAFGSLLWAGTAAALGFVFADELERVLGMFEGTGTLAAGLLVVLLAAYILLKWSQRRRLLVALGMARIEVDELAQALRSERPPLVLDVRAAGSRGLDDRSIPGAIVFDPSALDTVLAGVPHERELVLYCNCPNEVSAARAAQWLKMQGYRQVRPLRGGLEAWVAGGYAIERAQVEVPATSATSPAT